MTIKRSQFSSIVKNAQQIKDLFEISIVSYTYEDVLNDKGILADFKKKYIDKVFTMIINKKSEKKIEDYFSLKYAQFYHNNAPINR